jgi:hypothetical protein
MKIPGKLVKQAGLAGVSAGGKFDPHHGEHSRSFFV